MKGFYVDKRQEEQSRRNRQYASVLDSYFHDIALRGNEGRGNDVVWGFS